jgi:short-subunit dehydrogenase
VRKVVFLGATRGIGRAVARRMAERGDRLVLLGRDPEELRRSAADLDARGSQTAGVATCDLLRPETLAPALDEADRLLDGFDTVVVTAGLYGTQEALEADADARDRVLTVDFTNTVHFCEEARTRLLARGGGTLCVLSSVAGDRARKPVIFYGAAKAGLSFYLAGLDAKYRDSGLRTVNVKPGFVRTEMTAALPQPPFATDPDRVAPDIVKAIDRGTPEVYTPTVWRFVMLAVRNLPRFAMRKIKF